MSIPGVPQKSLSVFSILGGNRWSKLGKFGNINGQKTQFLIDFGQNWVERKQIRLNLAVFSSTTLFSPIFSILIFGRPGMFLYNEDT